MLPTAVRHLTYREIVWLLENIAEVELEEMSNRLTLAGGDGDKFRQEVLTRQSTINDYSVSEDTNLTDITEKLRGGYGPRNS